MKILVAILLPILLSQVVCQSGSGFGELDNEDLGSGSGFGELDYESIYEDLGSGSGFGELEDEDLGRAHHMFSQILKLRIYFRETLFVLFFLKVS